MKKNSAHDVLFSKNKIILKGVFAWMLYINIGIWTLSFLFKFIIFIVTLLK
jgi:hypothetical protein